VSLVGRGDPRVSPERRAAVEKAMADLGYRANAAARALARNRSDLIGVVLPGFANLFHSELAEALRYAGEARGFVPMLVPISEDPEREVNAIEHFLELRVAGLILVSPLLDMDSLAAYGALVPTVVVTRGGGPDTVDVVRSDDRPNTRMLTNHLLDRGYRPVAFVGYDRAAEADSSMERRQGYLDAVEAAGLPAQTVAARHGDASTEIAGLDDLLAPGVGVVCHNDRVAAHVLNHIEALGLRPGADVGVAGFDNTPLAHLSGASLTSVDLHSTEIARAAVELIDTRAAGRDEQADIVIPANLVERASTAGPVPPPG
jgi:LacI family transcriptional regulator